MDEELFCSYCCMEIKKKDSFKRFTPERNSVAINRMASLGFELDNCGTKEKPLYVFHDKCWNNMVKYIKNKRKVSIFPGAGFSNPR